MISIYAGLQSQTVDIFIQDSSSVSGEGLAGLVYNSAGLAAYYRKGATGSATAIALATQTVGGAWSSGGFVEVDATNMKGVYRLDIPNAAVDSAGYVTLFLFGASNMVPTVLRINCNAFPADLKAIATIVAAATQLSKSAQMIVSGTVDTVVNGHTPTTTVFQADDITEATTDHFKGRVVIFTSGALLYQQALITGYQRVGGIGQFTVATMTDAPTNNDTFILI